MKNIIKNYINNLEIHDVKAFLFSKEIDASDDEIRIIFEYIKRDWETIIYKDASTIFKELEQKLSNKTYISLIILYKEALKKYRDYL